MAHDFSSIKVFQKAYPKTAIQNGISNYATLRHTLQTGDLVFFSGFHWLSGLIRWRSQSAFSHVGIVVRIEEIDKVFIVESILGHGVRMIPFSTVFKDYVGDQKPYDGRVVLATCTALTSKIREEIKTKTLDYLTRQYDSKEFIRAFWRMIIGRIRIYPDRKFTCSELIFECYKNAGIKLHYERGNLISPGVIYRNDIIEFKQVII